MSGRTYRSAKRQLSLSSRCGGLTTAAGQVLLHVRRRVPREASQPLEPERRSAFLEVVAAELAAIPRDQRGDGSVERIVRAVQRDHYDAPDLSCGVGSPRSRAY